MADNGGFQGDLVFCHSCQNEWARERHGLQCPQCQSDFVEVIEHSHDPRDVHIEEYMQQPEPPPAHPLHNHNPWNEAPDPIEHIEWNSGSTRVHVTRTSVRPSSPGINRRGGPQMADSYPPIVQTVASFLGGFTAGPNRQPQTMRTENPRNVAPSLFGPYGGAGPYLHSGPAPPPISPLQEGPARQGFGGRSMYTATAHLRPRDHNNLQPQIIPVDDLHGLLGNLLQGLHAIGGHGGPGADDPMNPFTLLTSMMNPANATHGDAVYTQEALDRVISQLMEQHSGSSAPGPAPAAAINALPKKPVDKTMMGSDGKAECSVCMDNVEIGDEVTVLPCNHWFHGACVGAWLSEHDTCPHCRQGITPKEGATDAPRTPGQPPRHSQTPLSSGIEGSRRNPYVVPETPPRPVSSRADYGRRDSRLDHSGGDNSRSDHTRDFRREADRPDHRRRTSHTRDSRSSGDGNNGGGGVTGWIRNRLSGGGGI